MKGRFRQWFEEIRDIVNLKERMRYTEDANNVMLDHLSAKIEEAKRVKKMTMSAATRRTFREQEERILERVRELIKTESVKATTYEIRQQVSHAAMLDRLAYRGELRQLAANVKQTLPGTTDQIKAEALAQLQVEEDQTRYLNQIAAKMLKARTDLSKIWFGTQYTIAEGY